MTGSFEGRSVIVTGAARGLGRLAAERFAQGGARVVLCDRDEPELRAVAADLRRNGHVVETVFGDVAQEETAAAVVQAAITAFGRLDIAINNAGVSHAFRRLSDLDGPMVERMLAINVMGVFYGMKHQIPALENGIGESGRQGVIVNVASVAGLVGAPLLSAYAASKHAVVGLTRSAAAETARRGIRINALCPAFTGTDMVAGMLGDMRGSRDEAVDRIVSAVPMRRLADPQEVVHGLLWLCSADNSFVTGQAIAIDGGLSSI